MCRKNLLLGCILISAGAGVLAGQWIHAPFFTTCAGLVLVTAGICSLRR